MEFQSPTIGSSTEVDETSLSDRLEIMPSSATLDRTPSNQQLGQVSSIVPIVKTPLVGPAQAQPPLSLPTIPSLLVTVPLSQMPPVLLTLNLTPVNMPNRGTVPRVPAPIRTGPPPNLLPLPQTENALVPLLQLNVFPTSKIVTRLSQLKQKSLKGPTKRLT